MPASLIVAGLTSEASYGTNARCRDGSIQYEAKLSRKKQNQNVEKGHPRTTSHMKGGVDGNPRSIKRLGKVATYLMDSKKGASKGKIAMQT